MSKERLLKRVNTLELHNKTDFDLLAMMQEGLKNGYPECCIYAFLKDVSNYKSPAKLRGGKNGYVPCKKCMGGDPLEIQIEKAQEDLRARRLPDETVEQEVLRNFNQI